MLRKSHPGNLLVRCVAVAAAVLVAASSLLPGDCASASATMLDDFNGPSGSAPNPAYWSPVTGSGWDIGVETYDAAQAVLDGQGNLAIQAAQSSHGYRSGRIQTKGKLNLGYGRFSARIKMPSGQGLWPAFWLVDDNQDSQGRHPAEVDIIELVSSSTTYYSTIHGPSEGRKPYQVQFTGPIGDLSTGFHEYWATHAPDRITVGIDGQTLGTFTPDSLPPGAVWVFNTPMYAILTLAVGGDWAGPPDPSTQFPATMLVDSFRWEPM